MDEQLDEELGPIDFYVVEFPAGSTDFDKETARELLALVDTEMIRILDFLIIDKDDEGQTEAFELEELGSAARLGALGPELAEVLSADDIPHLAAAVEPAAMAGVLVWENRWAAPLVSAARRSGATLIAAGRIPHQALIDALDGPPPQDEVT